jgi:hypothetical protein
MVSRWAPLLLIFCTNAFAQQQSATEASLRGKWIVPESITGEALTFNAGQEFLHTYTNISKNGKEVVKTPRQLEGAYTVAPSACSVGPEKGNLWMVQGSNRCCFTAYHMGKTLVLDEVRSGGLPALLLCSSKTLKRPS